MTSYHVDYKIELQKRQRLEMILKKLTAQIESMGHKQLASSVRAEIKKAMSV